VSFNITAVTKPEDVTKLEGKINDAIVACRLTRPQGNSAKDLISRLPQGSKKRAELQARLNEAIEREMGKEAGVKTLYMKAKNLWKKAKNEYKDGKYEEALELWRQSLELLKQAHIQSKCDQYRNKIQKVIEKMKLCENCRKWSEACRAWAKKYQEQKKKRDNALEKGQTGRVPDNMMRMYEYHYDTNCCKECMGKPIYLSK
jgi:tetratricopeptide (TPR) repeat protein